MGGIKWKIVGTFNPKGKSKFEIILRVIRMQEEDGLLQKREIGGDRGCRYGYSNHALLGLPTAALQKRGAEGDGQNTGCNGALQKGQHVPKKKKKGEPSAK